MTGRLQGSVAIVTGAAQGIGAAYAKAMAAEGAKIVIADVIDGNGGIVDEIRAAGGEAVSIKTDVSSESAVKALVAETLRLYGKIDILVNNAGVYDWSPLEEITEEQFHRHFDVNVLGLLLATQEAVKQFDSTGGNIINISSTVTSLTPPSSSVYTGTKGAVDAITRTLAKELGPRKIRVNAINPGMVETEGVRAAGFDQGDLRKSVEAQTPLGRIGQPDDIAPAAVFLASSDSAWITGETLRVAGGLR
jgi:3-oxoacyl-[acyl-carrier protein] reductase